MSELWSFIIYSEIYRVQNLLNADFCGLGNSSLASVCISVSSDRGCGNSLPALHSRYHRSPHRPPVA